MGLFGNDKGISPWGGGDLVLGLGGGPRFEERRHHPLVPVLRRPMHGRESSLPKSGYEAVVGQQTHLAQCIN